VQTELFSDGVADLVCLAKREGPPTLTAEVFVENKPMMRVFRKLTLPMEVTTGEEVQELMIRLKWQKSRSVGPFSRSRNRESGRGGHKANRTTPPSPAQCPRPNLPSQVRIAIYLPISSLARMNVSWESTGSTRPGPRGRSTGPCSNRSSKV
jgi:hypothetical protein